MKRILFLAAVALLLAACTQETNPTGPKEVVATAIELNKHELTLNKGDNETLTVTFTPSDVTDKSLVWVSSNKSIAEVTDGVVVGVDAGSTEIIVKHGDLTDKCTVTVTSLFALQAVDLGLSVKWANANLGANAPEDHGDYYSWGETETKETYDWTTYKYANGSEQKLTKYMPQDVEDYYLKFWDGVGEPDGKTVLEKEDDAASQTLGGKWRMPIIQEMEELRSRCTWVFDEDKKGYVVTGTNGNAIFLPLAGNWVYSSVLSLGDFGLYWSSTICPDPRHGLCFYLTPSEARRYTNPRAYGFPIRPVSE